MSIMTDARLRLLEARVAEIEHRLGEPTSGPVETLSETSASTTGAAKGPRKATPKPRDRQRKAK